MTRPSLNTLDSDQALSIVFFVVVVGFVIYPPYDSVLEEMPWSVIL